MEVNPSPGGEEVRDYPLGVLELHLGFGSASGTQGSRSLGVPDWNLVLVGVVPGSQGCSPTSPSPSGFSCFRSSCSGKFRSLEREGAALI